ncbi:MAG TPA: hypothetical protein V6C78_04140 [Crinalium sp.]
MRRSIASPEPLTRLGDCEEKAGGRGQEGRWGMGNGEDKGDKGDKGDIALPYFFLHAVLFPLSVISDS